MLTADGRMNEVAWGNDNDGPLLLYFTSLAADDCVAELSSAVAAGTGVIPSVVVAAVVAPSAVVVVVVAVVVSSSLLLFCLSSSSWVPKERPHHPSVFHMSLMLCYDVIKSKDFGSDFQLTVEDKNTSHLISFYVTWNGQWLSSCAHFLIDKK